MVDINLELKLIQKFTVPMKQNRLEQFLYNEKRRRQYIDELARKNVFKEELFKPFNDSQSHLFIKIFKELNLSSCYVISENTQIDGNWFDFDNTIKNVLSPWADIFTLIIFGNVQIIYREHEGFKSKWLSIY